MSTKREPRFPIEPFRWPSNDPLAAQHEEIATLVSEALKSGWQYWTELNLEATGAGKAILTANPPSAAALVLALVAQASYYDGLARKARGLATDEFGRANWHLSPEWEAIWPPREGIVQVLRRLMRRKLPFLSIHLLALAEWMATSEVYIDLFCPVKPLLKAIEAYGPIPTDDRPLRDGLTHLAKRLREDTSKDAAKLGQQLEALLAPTSTTTLKTTSKAVDRSQPNSCDASIPAPVGSPSILSALKVFLNIAPPDEVVTETVGDDRFALRADSPLRAEHELINLFLPEVLDRRSQSDPNLMKTTVGRTFQARDPVGKGRLLLALVERCSHSHFANVGTNTPEDLRVWRSRNTLSGMFRLLMDDRSRLDRAGLFDLLLYFGALTRLEWLVKPGEIERLLAEVKVQVPEGKFTAGERHVLHRLRCQRVLTAPFGTTSEAVAKLTEWIGDNLFLALVPGEAWSDAVNRELMATSLPAREKWLALLRHCADATGSRPSTKWLKTGKENLKAVGAKKFQDAVLRWFPLVSLPRTIPLLSAAHDNRSDLSGTLHEDNATCLRGLLWLAPEVFSSDLIRAVGALTVSCYKKIPGVGPRAVKVGNAGVYALSQIHDPLAVGQLALLKIKVKFGSAQKEIEKAFTLAAQRAGLPREELEEMSVPTYGLNDVGLGEEKLGEFTARLTITGTESANLAWIKADGKTQRSIPAEVKAFHAEDLKELQASAKDIQKMLPAQRDRIDSLFLQQRSWKLGIWQDRYLNHPLVGTLARRILWEFTTGSHSITGIWFNGQVVDFDLKPIEFTDPDATVQLWHPIGRNTDEITAWRQWLETQQIQQPFKQAHREIYLLTEAEQRTRIYSNRYAAHVLKQHQFNALCALRGWKNQLRLMVDAEYLPPSILLPQWGLRAEFWVEGIGQDYGTDTNDAGVYLRLSTDQVRFYRIDDARRSAHAGGGGYHPGIRGQDAEPVPLDQIPPLVFSEIMRDVDLFVGVASIGNDPTWADGGAGGRYVTYWQNYSFGDLNASAKTRKDVLQRLVPKLKIAGVCRFEEKFLVVKGHLRTYKIHLGSGNILMEPNDQYLCIVPAQGGGQDSSVLLPFEGDRTLSVILSKAFVLANDTKITDSSIVSQITRK